MAFKEKSKDTSSALTSLFTFNEVVDKACDELMERQIKYSLRRIQEMGKSLCTLEQELDDFLLQKDRKQE